MKAAIVHDWLTGRRGGEKVLEAFCRIFPGADIFTLIYVPGKLGAPIEQHRIVASWLNRIPGAGRFYRSLLPLMPAAIESFDLRGYDLVISSSHAVAKGASVPPGVPHICYCHTPMRYAWLPAENYFSFGRFRRTRKLLLAGWRARLKRGDLRSNSTVTHFLANSQNVRQRIREFYGRDATVLHPPVDTEFFTPGPAGESGGYFLAVSALEPYKRVDLAIRAVRRLGGRLVVAGSGTQARALRRIAGGNVEFAGWVSDQRLRELYRGCRALIFPGLEDFGMVPVEAQACGRPVVAYGRGGACETVSPGLTGVFFAEQSEDALVDALQRLERIEFDAEAARRNSLRFSVARFEGSFHQFLERIEKTAAAPAAVSARGKKY